MLPFLVLAIVAISIVSASVETEDGVFVLTTSNFNSVVDSESLILVEFYAPWCGHCKSLAPEYAKAAKKLSGKVKLAKVDATVETTLGEKYEVRGYPTLKVFRNGVASEYKGGRTADTIVSYMEKQSLPACTTLKTVDEAKAFAQGSRAVVIGSFASASGDAYAAFKATVDLLRDDVIFGETLDASVSLQAFGVSPADIPAITLFKQYDDPKTTYTGAFVTETISAWIRAESVPLLDDISQENYKMYMDTGLPLAWIFFDPAQEDLKATIAAGLLPVAKAFKGKINFCFCDGVKFGGQAKNLGLSGDYLPSLAINSAKDQHYAFPGKSDLNTNAVMDWVKGVSTGVIAPTIKSQPEPEINNGPVTVLVGSNFERIAHDPTKDVLVEFYAPWCGHCKSLAPIYEELGVKYNDVESLIIAKMDATENDAVGVPIQGFPTIKFFPAKGNAMMDYSGGRDLKSLVSFLEENVAIPIVHGATQPAAADPHTQHSHQHHHSHDHNNYGDEL